MIFIGTLTVAIDRLRGLVFIVGREKPFWLLCAVGLEGVGESVSPGDEDSALSDVCWRDGRAVVSLDTDALENTEDERLIVCPIDDLKDIDGL